MPAWAPPAYVSGMTRDGTGAPNSYWLVDVGDSVWQFDDGTGLVNYFGTFTVPVGPNGIAFNPEDDCIRQKADVVVEGNDLGEILPILEKYM